MLSRLDRLRVGTAATYILQSQGGAWLISSTGVLISEVTYTLLSQSSVGLKENQRQQHLTTCRPKVSLVSRLKKVLRIAETHSLQSQDGLGQLA